MKRIVAVLLVVVALVTMVSCNKKVYEANAKEFTSDGLTLTLTDAFVKKDQEGYTVCYDSKSVAVIALKESFSLQEGVKDWTLEYYAGLIKNSNSKHSPSDPVKVGDRMVIEYTFYNPDTDITYHYYTCMYKGSDAFWMVQFACDVNDIEEYKPYMIQWADSVRV